MAFKPTKKDVIALIVLAQIASDAGKGIFDVGDDLPKYLRKEAETARDCGYDVKATYELLAIEFLNRMPRCGVNWYVEPVEGIVYFEIRVDGKRYQISFHNPGSFKFYRYSGKGRTTRWNRDVGGSRAAAEELCRWLKKQESGE